jgi:hypothetical protein
VKTVCPEVGDLRRSLDEPQEMVDRHLAECEACRGTVAGLRADAELAARAIGRLGPDAVPTAPAMPAWRAPAAVRPQRRGWRYAAAGLAAAALVGVLVTVPAAQVAAAQFLAQFRSQRFAAVQVDPGSAQGVFGHFKDLGVIQEPSRQRPERVADLAAASARVGFALKQPDPATLPAGVVVERIEVSAAHELRFTFQKAKAEEYLRRVGRPEHGVPAKLDGATLVVNVPTGALMRYRGASTDQAVVIGQAGEVTAGVEGNATLEELREYLLGLPGLPPEAVRQLRAIQDWQRTLPVPIPAAANVTWQNTTVGGAPALMLADPTGLGGGVIWQQNGRIYGVAGSLRAEEILRVANGLR